MDFEGDSTRARVCGRGFRVIWPCRWPKWGRQTFELRPRLAIFLCVAPGGQCRTGPSQSLPKTAKTTTSAGGGRGLAPGQHAQGRTLGGRSLLVSPSSSLPPCLCPCPCLMRPAHGTENMFLAFGKLDERNFLTRPLQRPVRVPISPSTLALIFGGIESIARRPCLILSDSSRRVAALHEF